MIRCVYYLFHSFSYYFPKESGFESFHAIT